MYARRTRKHKGCCSQHATDTSAATVNWWKNKPQKLEETCLGPESKIFEIPGQLHAKMGPAGSTRSPPTIHKDMFVGVSRDDPLFDEATNILSNRFPSRGVATIRTFIENAYETIRAEAEAATESSPSTHDSGTCPLNPLLTLRS